MSCLLLMSRLIPVKRLKLNRDILSTLLMVLLRPRNRDLTSLFSMKGSHLKARLNSQRKRLALVNICKKSLD